ncbi:hypothetical protein AB0891_34390 [Streptomyces sp. NPDC007259]|uniref:hypothetical protein n=1 Tax=Streptomyces sp. NPDC007259 TaxID=3154319 RepID=UPI0034518791
MTTNPTIPAPADEATSYAAEETVTITVELTVTEAVTYEIRTNVEVPADVAADPDDLHEHLAEHEELWLDDLDPVGGTLYINERHLEQVDVVLTS